MLFGKFLGKFFVGGETYVQLCVCVRAGVWRGVVAVFSFLVVFLCVRFPFTAL
jgi:hypothetical protein